MSLEHDFPSKKVCEKFALVNHYGWTLGPLHIFTNIYMYLRMTKCEKNGLKQKPISPSLCMLIPIKKVFCVHFETWNLMVQNKRYIRK